MNKIFIEANQLQRQSFALAKLILESDFRPTLMIGLWRGGSPIAITVHEALQYFGFPSDHISVKVSSYSGIDRRTPEIIVHDLNYIKKNVTKQDKILIVDDVHDTGLSMAKLIQEIQSITTCKEIKVAVAYYKPQRSQVNFKPDFYVNETNDWLVFPHELCGLNKDELSLKKPGIGELKSLISGTL